MKPSSEQLDLNRRAWPTGLIQQHATEPSGVSALALARGEWPCGECDDALRHFIEARDRAPDLPEAHMPLMRPASMQGLEELEASTREQALQQHPGQPDSTCTLPSMA